MTNFAPLRVRTPVESFTLLKLNVGVAVWLITAGALVGRGVSAAAIPLPEPIATAITNTVPTVRDTDANLFVHMTACDHAPSRWSRTTTRSN